MMVEILMVDITTLLRKIGPWNGNFIFYRYTYNS